MSASALLEMPPPQQDAPPPRQGRLDALRTGAQRLDPTRLHYLDVLARRIATAPEPVQRVLEGKLDAALTELEERLRQAQTDADDTVARLADTQPDQTRELQRLFSAGDFAAVRRLGARTGVSPPATPMAQLNQYLQRVKQNAADPLRDSHLGHSLASNGEARTELASVRRFREAWSRIAAEDQVIEAVERGPANAGPLNAHRLVLGSLALLRTLSPDYLRRFLSFVETLQWLEQASPPLTPVKAKPARRSRAKK